MNVQADRKQTLSLVKIETLPYSQGQAGGAITETENRREQRGKVKKQGNLSSECLGHGFVVDQTHGVLVLYHALDELSFRQTF